MLFQSAILSCCCCCCLDGSYPVAIRKQRIPRPDQTRRRHTHRVCWRSSRQLHGYRAGVCVTRYVWSCWDGPVSHRSQSVSNRLVRFHAEINLKVYLSIFAYCCLDSKARKVMLSLGWNNIYSFIINLLLLLSGSAMVTFENCTSYDKAVNAKSAKLRSRDWIKKVSHMNETITSSNHLELLMYLSAKLLELQSAMLVAGFDQVLIMFQIEIAPYRVWWRQAGVQTSITCLRQ